jgi:hypothetical protein
MLRALLYSRKFWLAVFGICQTVLFQYYPQFDRQVWQSIDALLVVLIASIAYEDGSK